MTIKMNKWYLGAILPALLFGLAGCPNKGDVEKESPTSGHLEIYTDEAHVQLVQQEADAFCRLLSSSIL